MMQPKVGRVGRVRRREAEMIQPKVGRVGRVGRREADDPIGTHSC